MSEQIEITFILKGGEEKVVRAAIGLSVLEVTRNAGIDLEGACEGSLACSTCHVIIDKDYFKRLVPPTDEEEDMLDLAFGLTDESRLGCQVILTQELDGMRIKLPAATRNQ